MDQPDLHLAVAHPGAVGRLRRRGRAVEQRSVLEAEGALMATKAISAARVKNDAVDARTLAHLLRTNVLAEAWIAPPDAREAPRLVRTPRRAGPDALTRAIPTACAAGRPGRHPPPATAGHSGCCRSPGSGW